MSMQWRAFWCFLTAIFLSGWFPVNSLADYSDRRIGKDGGVKAGTLDLSALEDIFALIDCMPTR
jgi:hypothetical protein